MSNLTDHLEASRARLALSQPWDGPRSRRVFEGALRSRASRARRQRFVAIACTASAALFVLAIHSAGLHGAASSHFEQRDQNASAGVANAGGSGDAVGSGNGSAMSSGAISMSSDMFADGGREAD